MIEQTGFGNVKKLTLMPLRHVLFGGVTHEPGVEIVITDSEQIDNFGISPNPRQYARMEVDCGKGTDGKQVVRLFASDGEAWHEHTEGNVVTERLLQTGEKNAEVNRVRSEAAGGTLCDTSQDATLGGRPDAPQIAEVGAGGDDGGDSGGNAGAGDEVRVTAPKRGRPRKNA